MTAPQTTDTRSREEAEACLRHIGELVLNLNNSTDDQYDAALEAIEEYPLALTVRAGWTSITDRLEADEYCILLSTGGPAVRLTGPLSTELEPIGAALEHQDWGTPWTALPLTLDQEQMLVTYASQFSYSS